MFKIDTILPEYESPVIIIIRRENNFVRRQHDSAELSSRTRQGRERAREGGEGVYA